MALCGATTTRPLCFNTSLNGTARIQYRIPRVHQTHRHLIPIPTRSRPIRQRQHGFTKELPRDEDLSYKIDVIAEWGSVGDVAFSCFVCISSFKYFLSFISFYTANRSRTTLLRLNSPRSTPSLNSQPSMPSRSWLLSY